MEASISIGLNFGQFLDILKSSGVASLPTFQIKVFVDVTQHFIRRFFCLG